MEGNTLGQALALPGVTPATLERLETLARAVMDGPFTLDRHGPLRWTTIDELMLDGRPANTAESELIAALGPLQVLALVAEVRALREALEVSQAQTAEAREQLDDSQSQGVPPHSIQVQVQGGDPDAPVPDVPFRRATDAVAPTTQQGKTTLSLREFIDLAGRAVGVDVPPVVLDAAAPVLAAMESKKPLVIPNRRGISKSSLGLSMMLSRTSFESARRIRVLEQHLASAARREEKTKHALDEAGVPAQVESAPGIRSGLPDDRIRWLAVRVDDLASALNELADLMDGVRDGSYTPDSFTTQPARKALSNLGRGE
jgi:hypothetical protein